MSGERETFTGFAKNIRKSGIFIATTHPKKPGSRCDMKFVIRDLGNLEVQYRCEVKWTRHFSRRCTYRPGMGIKVLHLPLEKAKRTENRIQSGAGF
jgi:hypothetical protein